MIGNLMIFGDSSISTAVNSTALSMLTVRCSNSMVVRSMEISKYPLTLPLML